MVHSSKFELDRGSLEGSSNFSSFSFIRIEGDGRETEGLGVWHGATTGANNGLQELELMIVSEDYGGLDGCSTLCTRQGCTCPLSPRGIGFTTEDVGIGDGSVEQSLVSSCLRACRTNILKFSNLRLKKLGWEEFDLLGTTALARVFDELGLALDDF
ncbi:hypothetical protein Tco_0357450 [Tanacetum coccineum]